MTGRTHYSRGRERRDELVEAAVHVIAARGIEGVTFRSVATQAGFPPSTTSYFFATVDDLIEAALLRVAATVVARIEELIARAESAQMAPDQLAAELIAVVADPSHDDTVAQFEAYLAVRRRPSLAPVVARISEAMGQACAVALPALGVRDTDTAGRAFVALIDGFSLHRMAGLTDDSHAAALREALFALLARYSETG